MNTQKIGFSAFCVFLSEFAGGNGREWLREAKACLILVRLLGLLQDREPDAGNLGERDKGLTALANHKHIRQARAELVAARVTDVGHIESAVVALEVVQLTDSANVGTAYVTTRKS